LDRYIIFFLIYLHGLIIPTFSTRYLRAKAEGLEQEAKLMADVQGWEVGKSPYHTERYVPPTQVTPLGVIP
jgi:hypothetical protein